MSGGDENELEREKNHLGDVLNVLRTRTRRDFSGYKKPTILRRIYRRMGLHQIRELSEYAKFLRQTSAEVAALSDDLMIHVTGFFRDAPVWDTLKEHVIAPLVAAREAGSEIRGWVTACASGEEAYTLCMLITEAAEEAGKSFDVKIFATDTADRAVARARVGIYPMGIESEVSPDRLKRFFDRTDSVYRIKKELRERVVFAPQNVLQDAPFSRLDICTCRNLLIYLEPDLQRRVLGLLHFGLREGGVLMLGTSETVTGVENLFEPIDKKARIFRRVGKPPRELLDLSFNTGLAGPQKMPLDSSIGQVTARALLERYTPAAVHRESRRAGRFSSRGYAPILEAAAGPPDQGPAAVGR
jgi:two-component system CheB/CheR fusion protein